MVQGYKRESEMKSKLTSSASEARKKQYEEVKLIALENKSMLFLNVRKKNVLLVFFLIFCFPFTFRVLHKSISFALYIF